MRKNRHSSKCDYSFKFDESDRFGIRVKVLEKDDKYGTPIGQLEEKVVEGCARFRWTETYPTDLLDSVRFMDFESKEIAANFLYLLNIKTEETRKKFPLPQEVTDYFERRANNLFEEKRNLLLRLKELQSEFSRLLRIAKENNLLKVQFYDEESDGSLLVNKLMNYKSYDSEGNLVRFFSEACLYPLCGKEEARSILRLIDDVCSFIDPTYEEKLNNE